MKDEVHSIDSQEIESIALRDVRVIFLIFPEGRGNDTGNFSSKLGRGISYGVMESMALTQKIWSPQHLILRYGACNIYP